MNRLFRGDRAKKAGERSGSRGRGWGKRKAGGGGGVGEPVDKLLMPLFRPLAINLMIICQQDHYQTLVALECNAREKDSSQQFVIFRSEIH